VISYPQRIVCLTEETTEILYLLDCGDRIVGISGFTMRPPQARQSKPKVSTFIDANYEKIVELTPDLVLAFSDLQADIVRELVRRGIPVVAFNQRSIEEILQAILLIGGMVGKQQKAEDLVGQYEERLARIAGQWNDVQRPRVYFEEWGDPLISGICWVSELIEIAGGVDIFQEFRGARHAKERIVAPEEVARRNPHIIIGSWCGKPFNIPQVRTRSGWNEVDAVSSKRVYEVDSTIILQPGPASLTDGLDALVNIIHPSST
jgi:iron complex transport system substrate-binding protein